MKELGFEMYTVELLQVELEGKQKNIRVIEILFFPCLSNEFTSGLCPLARKKHGEDLPDFCLQNI
jgi:hypothetical protein